MILRKTPEMDFTEQSDLAVYRCNSDKNLSKAGSFNKGIRKANKYFAFLGEYSLLSARYEVAKLKANVRKHGANVSGACSKFVKQKSKTHHRSAETYLCC